jgi:4,5-DOPA dioxygenase extradiol
MNKTLMPMIFVGHGSPMSAIEDDDFSRTWKALGSKLPRPKAILSISAHWYAEKTMVSSLLKNSMIYDMYGFPKELYEVVYEAPGDPTLAKRIVSLLGPSASLAPRGLDHGSWAPLKWIFPHADIPVVSLSLNGYLTPEEHFALGEKLKVLREEGVLIFASGDVVHNLGQLDWDNEGGFPFADQFDEAIKEAILFRDFEKVIHYEKMGPMAKKSVPTPEHFLPLLYVLGASDPSDRISVFNERRIYGSLSMTGYLFEAGEAV